MLNPVNKLLLIFLLISNPILRCYSIENKYIKDSALVASLRDSIKFYNNKGLSYIYEGEFDLGEQFLKKSIAFCNKLPESINKYDLGTGYINLAVAYIENWKFEAALSVLKKSEEIFLSNIDSFTIFLGITLMNEAIVYTKTGEYQKSISISETALKYISGGKDALAVNMWVSAIYNTLAVAYKKQKKYKESLEVYQKAQRLAKKYNKDLVPIIYNNMAMLYEEIDEIKNAESYYKLAVCEFKKNNKYKNLSDTYINFSNFYLQTDSINKAFDYSLKSSLIVSKIYGNKNPISSGSFRLMGIYFEKIEKYDSALWYYHKSILSLYNNYNDISVYSTPNDLKTISEIHLLKSLKNKASLFYRYYNLTKDIKDIKASLATYNIALQLIEKMRLSYQDMDSKLYLSENESKTYKEAILCAYKLWQVTGDARYKNEAFRYTVKSKSAVLLSAIQDTRAKGFGGIPDSLLNKEKYITRDIAFYKEKIYEEKKLPKPDSLKIDLWENKLFNLNNDYDNLIKYLETNYTKYYSLKYNPHIKTVEEIQERLDKDEALAEYSLDEKNLFIFFITKKSFEIFRQPIDSIFFSSVVKMRNSISSLNPVIHSGKDFSNFVESSSHLYNTIVKPIKTKANFKRLIVIPDDVLSLIPFEAFVIKNDDKESNSYNSLHFLIKDLAVSYSYSSSMLFESNEKKHKGIKHNVLAFAPHYEGDDTAKFRGNSRNGYRKNLSPIPGAIEEVNQIIKLLNGKSFENEFATEKNFKLNADKYAIIHLAMHGIIDNANPMYSKLVFTAVDDTIEDGFLNTHEIFNLNFNAHLAVLSSCQSGEGILQKGEGVMSLARGFSYAGCPNLVMTLWEIEDKTSADLMVSFYKYLKKGYPTDVALQKAKLDYINNNVEIFAHPFFWSSFQFIGDPAPLFFSKKIILITTSLLAFSLSLFISAYLKKGK